jgi:hypothetical protein
MSSLALAARAHHRQSGRILAPRVAHAPAFIFDGRVSQMNAGLPDRSYVP